ncbi:MAG: AAA family ATPase [Bacteroidales bacterium]|nr:AAA family ATPase [Bacteroidales bacterium]
MTKIKKISRINNLAVFKDFAWDNSVKKKDGSVEDFKEINIIYGRNYSGKTTLSRIIRALETHNISDKYDNPEFEIMFDDGTSINQTQLNSSTYDIRVFNEDFVRDNLAFLRDTNKDGEIKSFAILGEDNARLQSEIDALNTELGSNEGGNESGLYKDLKEKRDSFKAADLNYKSEQNLLDKKLSDKATNNREIAIKYKPELFGDQNYNKPKLESDILTVSSNYTPINDTKRVELQALLNEKTKDTISCISEIKIDIPAISVKVKELVEQKVGDSHKINELVLDAELNRWVKEGRINHKDRNRQICAFCGNPISNERWAELDKHFDEESEKLENNIEDILKKLYDYEQKLSKGLGFSKEQFFSKFTNELSQIENDYETSVKNIALDSIKKLISQLNARKNNIFIPLKFEEVFDFSINLSNIYERYHKVEQESNNYSNELAREQKKAKSQLRLDEVYRYIQEINYLNEKDRINELKAIRDTKETETNTCEEKINTKRNEINTKLSLMNDEEKGAIKVGEYLKEYFGHNYLTLQAKAETTTIGNSFKFEVLRNGQPAYNLSEGECSLIAFCYFMAKLEDISTHDKKPIIWIDDPISSLDSNHVFFVYSMINGKIFGNSHFHQLFISTHNLDFLKYLKRLPGVNNDEKRKKSQFFLLNRINNESSIQIMPTYLQTYITEFNYLFKQVYDCAHITSINDNNYSIFYNFGNNARKFLELYLYYKYPDNTKDEIKRKKFFGDEIEAIITGRLCNEYSHLCGILERGEAIVEVPEMKKIALIIINAIKLKDPDQYNALLNSIGVVETT